MYNDFYLDEPTIITFKIGKQLLDRMHEACPKNWQGKPDRSAFIRRAITKACEAFEAEEAGRLAKLANEAKKENRKKLAKLKPTRRR